MSSFSKRRPCVPASFNCIKDSDCCSDHCFPDKLKDGHRWGHTCGINIDQCTSKGSSCFLASYCCSGVCGHIFHRIRIVGRVFKCKTCISNRPRGPKLCIGNNYKCQTHISCCSHFCDKDRHIHVCRPIKVHQPKEHPHCTKNGDRCKVPARCCSGHCGRAAPEGKTNFVCQECVGPGNNLCFKKGHACRHHIDCCTRYCSKERCKTYGAKSKALGLQTHFTPLLSVYFFFSIIFYVISE